MLWSHDDATTQPTCEASDGKIGKFSEAETNIFKPQNFYFFFAGNFICVLLTVMKCGGAMRETCRMTQIINYCNFFPF